MIWHHSITTVPLTWNHGVLGREMWHLGHPYDQKTASTCIYGFTYRSIFTDLSTDNLLSRCVVGATQNQNESLNSLECLRCPKQKLNGTSSVKYAAASAVIQFNGGSSMASKVMEAVMKRLHTAREVAYQGAEGGPSCEAGGN